MNGGSGIASRPFRILALDGGGVKGAYAASVLATLEETTQCSCRDYFDLISGTSTGGIIALGLALGRTAREMCNFYAEYGDDIFPISGVAARAMQTTRQLVRPKHDATRLRAALKSVFEDRTLAESSCRLVIPAYDLTEGRVFLFKTGHHTRFRFDIGLTAVDVAMATSAAPTLFTPAMIRRGGHAQYIDGGVWANCPALVALTEAMHFLDAAPTDVDILSIGTTSQPFVVSRRRSAGGVLHWGSALIELIMTSQVQAVEAQASLLTEGGWHRINHITGRGRFGLDLAESTDDLIELGRSDAVKKANLSAVEKRFLNDTPAPPFVASVP
jgi:patatin-like phospholipase/acyl hydrolase